MTVRSAKNQVYLSVGSNVDREKYIISGLTALKKKFISVECSPVYESHAVGFAGSNFFNLVVGIQTELSVGELSTYLKDIENQNGRDRSQPKYSSRTLDIDILTYNQWVGNYDGVELPRDEITKHAFVLLPFSDIAPFSLHPTTFQSYETMWKQFDKTQQKIWKSDFKV